NTAFIRDGAFVAVPRGKVVETPIHLVFVSTAEEPATIYHPRNLIILGENSQITIAESYISLEENECFTNTVTEFVVGKHAVAEHYKIQRESKQAYHIATTAIHLERDSKFSSQYVGLGGSLVRNEVRALFNDEGGECTLNGVYFA